MKSYAQDLSDAAERNRRIAEYMPMARRIALRIARRTRTAIAEDDLVAAAYLGLTEAADGYDLALDEPFLIFAERRIRECIHDEMRRSEIVAGRIRARVIAIRVAMKTTDVRAAQTNASHEFATINDPVSSSYVSCQR